MMALTSASSFWKQDISFQMEGCWCPTKRENLLFHPSHMLFVLGLSFRVASLTFQSSGGYLGGMRLKLMAGTPSSGMWRLLCINVPDTYVWWKYSRRGTAASGQLSFRYSIPAATLSTRRKARPPSSSQNCLNSSLSLYTLESPRPWIFLHVLCVRW